MNGAHMNDSPGAVRLTLPQGAQHQQRTQPGPATHTHCNRMCATCVRLLHATPSLWACVQRMRSKQQEYHPAHDLCGGSSGSNTSHV